MRGRSPRAIVDALTSGSMRYQGLALSGDERRAVAEFITGRRIRGTVSGATVGACGTRTPPFADPFAAAVVERLGADPPEHAFSAGGAGGPHRRSGAAPASQVGVRFSRHDVRLGAADDRRRPPVRRQPERHRLFARRRDRLHRLDVRGAQRRARGDLHRRGEPAPAGKRPIPLT